MVVRSIVRVVAVLDNVVVGSIIPITPLPLIVIVVPSTFTPPNCVVDAVAIPIVPLVFVIPLVPTTGIITPPNALVVAAVNE